MNEFYDTIFVTVGGVITESMSSLLLILIGFLLDQTDETNQWEPAGKQPLEQTWHIIQKMLLIFFFYGVNHRFFSITEKKIIRNARSVW